MSSGDIEHWVIGGAAVEGQTVAYGNLGYQNPATLTAAYDHRADPVIEIQVGKDGVRLAHLLNTALE